MRKRIVAWLTAMAFCIVGFGIEPITAMAATEGEETSTEPEQTYTITFDLNGKDGTIYGGKPSVTYQKGETANLPWVFPADPDSYFYGGWYKTPDCSGDRVWGISPADEGDQTLYVKWLNVYKVTYSLGEAEGSSWGRFAGGLKEVVDRVIEGCYPNNPPPGMSWDRSAGWEFDGWDRSWYEPITEDTVITAQWKKLPKHTVTFDLAGGTRIGGGSPTQSVYEGMAIYAPKMMRAGYRFVSWDGDYENVTSDQTFTAQWEPGVTHTVTFDPAGGALPRWNRAWRTAARLFRRWWNEMNISSSDGMAAMITLPGTGRSRLYGSRCPGIQ